jgi:hypothetical protein
MAAQTLVENGTSTYAIVVPVDQSEKVMTAAGELQKYLEKISSVKLPIVKEDVQRQGLGIYLGQTQKSSKAGVDVKQGGYPLKAEFRIRTVGGDLFLVGNDGWLYEGTAYAVFDLLERLGCRWYMPGAKGEVVPKRSTVSLDVLDVHEVPDFYDRSGVWYEYCWEVEAKDKQELAEWGRHNRVGSRWIPIAHNMDQIMPADKYFEAHPEWYPLIDGKRQGMGVGGAWWHPCVSNEEFQKFVADYICDHFEKNPDERAFSLALNDVGWEGWCQCEKCKAMSGAHGRWGEEFTRRYLRFVSAVAKRVKTRYPDRLIDATIYSSTQVIPEDLEKLEDNVFLCIMHYCWCDQTVPIAKDKLYKDIFTQASRIAPGRLGVYEYYGDFNYHQMPIPAWCFMDLEFDAWKKWGVMELTIEGANHWCASGLAYYVAAKKTWNPSLRSEDIVEDFLKNFFGPAADPMRRYFRLRAYAFLISPESERNARILKYDRYMNDFDACLAEAKTLAQQSPYAERIDLYVRYQNYMKSYYHVWSLLDSLKENPTPEGKARAQKAMDEFAELIQVLGKEGIIAYPSAKHSALEKMEDEFKAMK